KSRSEVDFPEVFADGFAGIDPIINTRDAQFRPMGIAFSPDGSMFISDSREGRIWKINYILDKENFSMTQLEKMNARKALSHIRTPDKITDRIELASDELGQNLYNQHCVSCHQLDGQGAASRFPTLTSNWVNGEKQALIKILLNGAEGDLEVNGEMYTGVMPKYDFLTDDQIADLLTYIRKSFGNTSSAISMDEVEEVRKSNKPLKP
ncbi:MAG: c-type cytochrome, partial [Flavobacteriaceae bacterium]